MNSPRVTYTPRADTTKEAELNALVAVYRFLLFEISRAKTKAAEPAPEPGDHDDVKESNGYAATDKYTR